LLTNFRVQGEEAAAPCRKFGIDGADEQCFADEASGVFGQSVESGRAVDVVEGKAFVDADLGSEADDRVLFRLEVVEEGTRGHAGVCGDVRHGGAGQAVFEDAGDRGHMEGVAGQPRFLRAQGFFNGHKYILHHMQTFTNCKSAIVHYFTVCRVSQSAVSPLSLVLR
jgi:hypothetical protein